jgi:hypothetical protein
MNKFENIANTYNAFAKGRNYEVRLNATETGIEYRTLNGSLIWHHEKIAAIDMFGFAIEVEKELNRIGERLAAQKAAEAKEVTMNCLNGNCGKYQTEHIEGCEFASKIVNRVSPTGVNALATGPATIVREIEATPAAREVELMELAGSLQNAQEAIEKAAASYKRLFPNHLKFYQVDLDEIAVYVRQARKAITQECLSA